MLCFPYAKINLGLAVKGKRSDGFHSIESVLCPVNLFDILEILESDKDELLLSGFPFDIKPKDNLVWKALQLMRKSYNFPPLKIHLHKQIPFGAGLGGGSSDATHTLLSINQLFKLGINESILRELTLEIGSDCPFFIKRKVQLAKGRGELLEPLELYPKALKLLIIIPEIEISTKAAYSNIIPEKGSVSIKEAFQMPVEKWKSILRNDFEKLAFDEFPLLFDLKNTLYQNGAIYASLSGSGSGMFGFFEKQRNIDLPSNVKSFWLDF